MSGFTVGIDVGGTFTDFMAMCSSSGEQVIAKVSTTPDDPSIGVLNGLEQIAGKFSLSVRELLQQTDLIIHGTTVTTNAVLTGNGAKTGLLTTEGFRDILQMRRGVRSREHLFNNKYMAPPPLVERDLRIGINERADISGNILKPVQEQELEQAAGYFKEEGVKSVAICFMHAYANAANEQAAKKVMEKLMPEAFITISSDVSPLVRLYNRVSTTVMNAYVGPILKSYIDHLLDKLGQAGFEQGELLIMQSNGGISSPANVALVPASTVLSGPAGGPIAGSAFARACGHDEAILIDMGGTSFEASIIRGGEVAIRREGEINRNHISLPMAAIHSIGAGGGSIAWIDEGGMLRVGPQSAGADPGPACYGRGGELPTCSDADLVLGYLNPGYFLGGGMKLDLDKAREAIRKHIAEPLGMTVEEAAFGIYQISNLNMVNGIKEVTVQNGYDPRQFPIVVAGGAGPVHAAMMAHELGISKVIVPKFTSVLCAVGMLASNLRHDYVQSYQKRWTELDFNHVADVLSGYRKQGMEALAAEGVGESQREVIIGMDVRYVGQHYEVTIEFNESVLLENGRDQVEEMFHQEHERLYGYHLRGHEIEIVNLRISCRGRREAFRLPKAEALEPGKVYAARSRRMIYDPMLRCSLEVPVYDGEGMKAGVSMKGPCIVELITTTIVVPSGFALRYEEHGSFVLNDLLKGE